jgi:threonyl-tRNA synthetase
MYAKQIRVAQDWKVPVMLILGKKEEEKDVVSVRLRSGEEYRDIKIDDLLLKLTENIKERKIEFKI